MYTTREADAEYLILYLPKSVLKLDTDCMYQREQTPN